MTAVLVVGPGRCGTSVTARLLHQGGIPMGEKFIHHDDDERGQHFCCWEDEAFYWPIKNYTFNRTIGEQRWRRRTLDFIKRREAEHGIWGVKETRIADIPEKVFALFKVPPIIIRCCRSEEGIVESWIRVFGSERERIRETIRKRTRRLDIALSRREHLSLDFDSMWNEAELQKTLLRYIRRTELYTMPVPTRNML